MITGLIHIVERVELRASKTENESGTFYTPLTSYSSPSLPRLLHLSLTPSTVVLLGPVPPAVTVRLGKLLSPSALAIV